MRVTSLIHPSRLTAIRWGAVILAALASSAGRNLTAHAEISGCMSDPIALLSNGATVDMRASINDTTTDVQQVAYTLHAPTGTSIVGWSISTNGLGPKETLTFYADNTQNTYTTTTVVTTFTPHISAVATTQIVHGLANADVSIVGWSEEHLSGQVTL